MDDNTNNATCEGGIIDNAQAIINLAKSPQSLVNVINLCGDNGSPKWVNEKTSIAKQRKYNDIQKLKDELNKEYKYIGQNINNDTVYPVYYSYQLYEKGKSAYKNNNLNKPVIQYQIVSDFERAEELSCAEWGLLDTKSGITTGNSLQNLTIKKTPKDKGLLDLYPKFNIKTPNGVNYPDQSDYVKIVQDNDDGGKTCLQLRVSSGNTSTGKFSDYCNSTSCGILCSSMFFGSCEITVRAKFPPITGGIFGIWTFRSDLVSASQTGGAFSFDESKDYNKNDPDPDTEDLYINPSNPCLLSISLEKDDNSTNQSSGKCNISVGDNPTQVLSDGYNNPPSFKYLLKDKVVVNFGSTMISNDNFNDKFYQKIDIESRYFDENKNENKDYVNGFSQYPLIQCTPTSTDTLNCSDFLKDNNTFVQIPNYNKDNNSKINNIFPNYTFTYSDDSDTYFGGVANRNDEIDIEIPSNSPGNSWSRDYWSTDISKGWTDPFDKTRHQYYGSWRNDKKYPESQIHMGMWHRINNNSYTYTNNQGSGGVPYVNMWGDACCTGVISKNFSSKNIGSSTGGLIVNTTDNGYFNTDKINDIKCPIKGGYNQNCNKGVKINEYIEILQVDDGSNWADNVGENINTVKQAKIGAKNITRVQLHYDKLFIEGSPNYEKAFTNKDNKEFTGFNVKTDYLDEKYHDYTISWCSGKPPIKSDGTNCTPDDQDYWDMNKWLVKPTASFYIDGKFQSKTSAYIPRRYSQINIGFINPTSNFNHAWHGPYPSNVKYAHTYIKRITITPFISDNDNINTSGDNIDDSLTDYWWPMWKGNPSLLRNTGLYSFYKPLGVLGKDSRGNPFYQAKYWATQDRVGFNYSVTIDSKNNSILTKNPIDLPSKNITSTPYWGDINYDNIKLNDTENTENTCNSNSLFIGDGSEENNSRIFFLKKFYIPESESKSKSESEFNSDSESKQNEY